MTENQGRELAWDDTIENDGEEFILLPEGEYNFQVTNFERARFPGGKNIGPCNKAIIHMEIDGGEAGKTSVKEDLILHTKLEWKICQFFTSIGQRQKGEKLTMNWNAVPGSKGRCKINIRVYDKKDGTKGQINNVETFLPPNEVTQASGAGYKKGAF